MTDNSKKVLEFLKENYGKEFSKRQIAEESGIIFSAVNGSIRGLTNRNYVDVRQAAETIENKVVVTTYVKLNEDGLNYDPDEEARLKKEKAMEERALRKAQKKMEEEV